MYFYFFTLLTESSNFTQQLKLRKILFKMSLLLKCYSWRGIITPTIISIQNRIMHSCLVPVYVQNMVNQRTEGRLLTLNI